MRTQEDQGSVSVHVLNREGEPFVGQVQVFANGAGWTREYTGDGDRALVLRHLPFGKPFSVCVDAGELWKGETQDCEAILAGETGRQVTVAVARPAPVFVGRIRGAKGKPLGRLAVRMEMHRPGNYWPFLMCEELDVGHKFRFFPKGPLGDRVTVWARVDGYWIDQTLQALVPEVDSEGVCDFGDVKLVMASVKLAGRVCFPDGSPASGVHLEWGYEWGRTQEESDQVAERRASLKPLSRCALGRLRALGLKPSGNCMTAVDGSFRVLGPETNERAYFGTQKAHICKAGTFLLPRDTSAFYTEAGMELTLVPAASLKCVLTMERTGSVDVFVDYPDGYRFLVCTVGERDQEFTSDALYPGSAELIVVGSGGGEVLASLGNLSLVPGVQTFIRV